MEQEQASTRLALETKLERWASNHSSLRIEKVPARERVQYSFLALELEPSWVANLPSLVTSRELQQVLLLLSWSAWWCLAASRSSLWML